MSIFKKENEVSQISFGGRAVAVVYYGARVVWQAVRSCFGRGYWVNAAPWSNTDAWKNE